MAPPVVGIVGGIGSGKSLVAAEFASYGGHLIAADRLGHDALALPEVKAQIVARWGEKVLDEAGAVDRKRVAAIVFNDPRELRALEVITHPVIGQRIREEIAKARAQPGVRLIVLDAAIMLEAGWHNVCDELVFVDAPQDVRLARLKSRGWDAAEVERREKAQMPLEEKRRRATAVVENSVTRAAVVAQVRDLAKRMAKL